MDTGAVSDNEMKSLRPFCRHRSRRRPCTWEDRGAPHARCGEAHGPSHSEALAGQHGRVTLETANAASHRKASVCRGCARKTEESLLELREHFQHRALGLARALALFEKGSFVLRTGSRKPGGTAKQEVCFTGLHSGAPGPPRTNGAAGGRAAGGQTSGPGDLQLRPPDKLF